MVLTMVLLSRYLFPLQCFCYSITAYKKGECKTDKIKNNNKKIKISLESREIGPFSVWNLVLVPSLWLKMLEVFGVCVWELYLSVLEAFKWQHPIFICLKRTTLRRDLFYSCVLSQTTTCMHSFYVRKKKVFASCNVSSTLVFRSTLGRCP